jgi:hypothetical protein
MNNENGEILAALSKQVSELREMNVLILREAASIQAALNTLLSLQAQEDDSALEIYRTQFFSMRATITAALEHLTLQKALEEFLSLASQEPSLLQNQSQSPELERKAA